ncbi:putative ketoreductase [Kockovaella imperatae]|uniref:Putative ketoreductase n=1 Tax=Kockovaella imperatae TaxID=4999 RepID=A0A1Y1UC74_9TREE|nr:putative ketoreductase [Kockovaella imperatae]ORX35602.1 putative ketoreductase [Kockovaella imperatae]
MVLDTVQVKSHSHAHPSFHILGQEIVVDLPIPALVLAFLGAGVAFRYLISFLRLILELTIIPGTNIKSYKSKTGSYALVTGCTSGIGLEFAKQFAGKGYNLILLGRRQTALDDLVKEISGKYKVDCKTVMVDLGDASSRAKGFAQVEKLAQELDVAVLVNNAGVSHEVCVIFNETPHEEIDAIVQTNILGTLHLTRTVLPYLVARSKKGSKSLILNVGSLDGRIPAALLAAYSCTKGGLQTWTKALAWELRGTGVQALMVQPAFVISNMSKIRRASLTVPTAKAWVKSCLSSIGSAGGAQGRAYEMTPYWSHAIMDYAAGFFGYPSEMIGMWVVDYMHKDIRKRWLRKKARESKKSE